MRKLYNFILFVVLLTTINIEAFALNAGFESGNFVNTENSFELISTFPQDFSFTLSATPETCEGNGTITISTTGTTVGQVLQVVMYKDGNTVTPYRVTDTTATSADFEYTETVLSAGSYEIHITDSENFSPPAQTIFVAYAIEDIQFSYSQAYICGGTKITVTASGGHPETYSLIHPKMTAVILFEFMGLENTYSVVSEYVHTADTECKPQYFYMDGSLDDTETILHSLKPNGKTFQLFSHGRPGELLLNGEWMDAEKIARFLKPRIDSSTQLNIYGCEFAKGEKGLAAVNDLEKTLGLSVAASNNITGIDGDWELEVGAKTASLKVSNYMYNLQCSTGRKYDVYAYYRSAGGHCTKTNYLIQSGAGNLTPNPVDQSVAPTDLSYGGKSWKKLTTTAVQANTSNQIRVILRPYYSDCNGSYILADAILLVDNFGNHYIIDNTKGFFQVNWTTTSNSNDYKWTCTCHQKNQNTSTSDQFLWDFFEKDHLLDSDGDGVLDACDLDDDNDGILNTDEGCSTLANTNEQNGTFGTLASGTRDLVVNPGNGYAYVGDLNGEGRYVVVAHNNVANVHWSTHFDHIYG
ncbi:MAG: DUF4347 domain-containing protein [Draconibacterium sp.]